MEQTNGKEIMFRLDRKVKCKPLKKCIWFLDALVSHVAMS